MSQNVLLDRSSIAIQGFALIALYGKELAKTNLLDPEIHHYIVVVQKRRQTEHNNAEPVISNEQVLGSYEWAAEFKQAIEEYLSDSA